MRPRTTMRRNNKWICLGIMLAVAIGLASCDRKTIYYHYEHAPVEGWEKGDVLSFEVPPVSEGTYREEVGLRIDKSYPFLGLCLVMKQTILPSGYVHLDTLNCNLIDQDGNNKGPGLSYYQYSFHVNTLRLQEGDSLYITVKHNMKREMMPGIADVGIRLDKQ